MRIKYLPEGRTEPHVWDFEPGKLLVPEVEIIEKNTGMLYGDWVAAVQNGAAGALRGYVWAMLKRHVEPTITWRQVVFPMDAVSMEYDENEDRAILASLVGRKRRGEEMTVGELALIAEMVETYGEPPAEDIASESPSNEPVEESLNGTGDGQDDQGPFEG